MEHVLYLFLRYVGRTAHKRFQVITESLWFGNGTFRNIHGETVSSQYLVALFLVTRVFLATPPSRDVPL